MWVHITSTKKYSAFDHVRQNPSYAERRSLEETKIVRNKQDYCYISFFEHFNTTYWYPFVEYFLVQFTEDNIKTVVVESDVIKDNSTTKAMYSDKKYYPCVVLSESGKFF